ncbi:N-acyl-D-amino-acid deacylase family protein [Anaeromyxobacter oryzae]|uniref:Aminoacylase n=1 Tax=Anaeromyxobacter oryzae TaxID=2918170 RepID=A0ABM7X059_9BACT|nr:amidohydrolase family protein [Anaeromyxobacter oryzae]BDG05178.1 aminoacylase [Anaeromyxobacter oryzae]
MDLDLVVANGLVIDGTGGPQFRADVGIRRGRIEVVARAGGLAGARVVDASGLAVAPGFVDLDSHADWAVAQEGAAAALARWLRQGVTTLIGGACGYSSAPVLGGGAEALARQGAFLRDGPFVPRWRTFGEFLDVVEGDGVPLNVGFLVGQNTLRAQAMGAATSPAPPEALRTMLDETREALRAGALGFSANAAFAPGAFADAAELGALARLVAREGGLFAVHARAYTRLSSAYRPSIAGGPHNLRAIRDLVELARGTGARLQISHLMLAGRRTWRTCDAVLGCLDAARAEGVDVAFDAAPYTVAVGPIQLLFPAAFVASFPESDRPGGARALRLLSGLQRGLLGMGPDDVRLRRAGGHPALAPLEGRSFAEIAHRLGVSPTDAQLHIARRAGMNGASVLVGALSGDRHDDAPLRALLLHPLCAIATNAASTRAGPQNPSATGAFPRFLGRYVRELALVPLEEAVRRMTSLPAARLGLARVGRVAEGCWADLTVFDPATVRDAADPERADAAPEGIRTVLVSGVPVVDAGRVVDGVLPGRVLRSGPA